MEGNKMATLKDFDVEGDLQIWSVRKNDRGEVVCPIDDCQLGERGPIELPGSRVLNHAVGGETLKSLGWMCEKHNVRIPFTVTGPDAHGLLGSWVGVPLDFDEGNDYWVPVQADDLDRNGGAEA